MSAENTNENKKNAVEEVHDDSNRRSRHEDTTVRYGSTPYNNSQGSYAPRFEKTSTQYTRSGHLFEQDKITGEPIGYCTRKDESGKLLCQCHARDNPMERNCKYYDRWSIVGSGEKAKIEVIEIDKTQIKYKKTVS